MKQIKIQCVNTDNYYEYFIIKIYDYNNKEIISKKTNIFGYITYELPINQFYKILILNKRLSLLQKRVIYVKNNYTYYIYFNNISKKRTKTIIIKLKDHHYDDLPIDGKVILRKK